MAQIRPSYPIVTYPLPVLDAFCYDDHFPVDKLAPFLEPYPLEPQNPGELPVKEPKPVSGDISFNNWAGVVCLFIACFAFSFTKEKENVVAVFLGILFVLVALYSWYGSFAMKERYAAALAEFTRAKEAHAQLQSTYQQALARYRAPETYFLLDQINHKRLRDYAGTDSFSNHCKAVQEHERYNTSETGLLVARARRVEQIEAYTRRYAVAPVAHEFRIAEGVFDAYFTKRLKEAFPGKILSGFSVVEAEMGICRYFPDAVYADFDNHLFIDIEIDEPYTNKGGEGLPIHCCYTGQDGRVAHEDDFRNAYFNEQGWTVVRFSEAQVAEDTEACLAFLRKIVRSFATGLMVNEQAVSFRHACWTEAEARDLFEAGSRTRYFSARIMSHSNQDRHSLVRLSHGADSKVRKDQKERPLGFVRIEQFVKSDLLPFAKERRMAYFSGVKEELENVITQLKLEHGSVLPGRIVLKETIDPQWKGQKPKAGVDGNPVGFKVYNTFYPVYTTYIYTEDVQQTDVVLTEDAVRVKVAGYSAYSADDLPF